MDIPIRPPVEKIRIEVCDFFLDKAIPKLAAGMDAQVNCDDASHDFINEKLHSFIKY